MAELDMTEEAIILYDRDGFFAGILERLRKKLRELGAQRKRMARFGTGISSPITSPAR
jgi:hypothetical protein